MSDIRHIVAFHGSLRRLLRYLGGDVPMRRIQVLLRVAEGEPITLAEIGRSLGAPSGTIYDHLRALGKGGPGRKKGAGLVQEVPRGAGEPAHRYCLTVRGQRAMASLQVEMEGMYDPPEAEEDEPLREYFEAVRHGRG